MLTVSAAAETSTFSEVVPTSIFTLLVTATFTRSSRLLCPDVRRPGLLYNESVGSRRQRQKSVFA